MRKIFTVLLFTIGFHLYAQQPAPTTVTATSVTATSFVINWSQVTGAGAYGVFVSTDPAFSSTVLLIALPSTATKQVVNTNLNPNTTYYYKVVVSGHSFVVHSVTTLSLPTTVTTSSVTATSFVINWSKVDGTIAYAVNVATDPAFSNIVYTALLPLSATSTLVNTNINPSTVYYYSIRVSTATPTVYSVTTLPGPPRVPTGLTTSSVQKPGDDNYVISLSWTSSPGATSYTVDLSEKTDFSFKSSFNVTGTSTELGINYNTVNYIRISATNANGTSAYSSVKETAILDVFVNQPDSVRSNSFKVSWTPVPVFFIDSYIIDVSSDEQFQSIEQSISTGPYQTSVVVSGLLPNQQYFYRVTANSADEDFENSGTSIYSWGAINMAPPAPGGLFSEPIDISSSDVLWSPVANAYQYAVDVSSDSTFTTGNIMTNLYVTGTRQTVTGLRSGTVYYFRVRASSNIGAGISNNSFTRQVAVLQPAPQVTPPTNIDSVSFVANWKSAPGAQLYWLEVASDTTFASYVNGYAGIPINSTSSLVVGGLSAGKTYYYRARASSANGISTYSQHQSVQVAPLVAGGGSAEDPFRVNVIPPSPEAAALAKYADTPVSLYSGTPEISIPLYELKERGLSLPISLSYQATGHKVETVAPRTGLGWSLNAGGVVTRVVRGWPDEHPRGWLRLDRPFNTIGEIVTKSDDDKYRIYDPLAEGCADAEPDLFYFNFAGYTGQFMFDADRTLKIVSGSSIKIDPIGLILNDPSKTNYIQGWNVTVDDGTTFTFTTTETTEVSQQISFNPCSLMSETAQNQMPQSWFLTDMRSADQQSWIHFDYTGYSQFNTYWSLETDVRNPSSSQASTSKEKLQVTNFGFNLNKITVSSGQTIIDFIPATTARADVTTNPSAPNLNNNFALAQINVSNGNSLQVKHWGFQYTYSTHRLTLASLTESAGGITNPPYQFAYTGVLPSDVASFARDHWGFNNNNPSTTTLIPTTTMLVNGRPVILPGADRSPSNAVLNGMLSQITYPTGGKDVFTFEPHDYSFEQGSELIDNVTIAREKDVSAFVDTEDQGERFASHSVNLIITAPSPSEKTTVTITYQYGINPDNTGFAGGLNTPYASVTDSRGNVLDGIGQIPRHNQGETSASITSTLQLKPGTYTITASQNLKLLPGGISSTGGFSLVVSAQWYEDTGQRITEKRKGGGVRIGKIVRSFGNGNPDKVTKYDYTFMEGGKTKSSGSLLESGFVYEYNADYVNVTSDQNGLPAEMPFSRLVRFSQNRSALGTTQGSHVGYQQVTVSQGENGENGRSVYLYNSPRQIQDSTAFTVPFQPSESFDYQRGLLLKQADFAAHSNDTLHVVKNTYHFTQQSITALKVGWLINGTVIRGGQHLDIYAIGVYDNILGYARLIDSRERTFNAGIPVETHATFQYNESTHKQLISSTVTDSKGETFVTSIKYPKDYDNSNSGLNVMQTLHMDNVPVEKLTWKQGTGNQVFLLSGIKTDFAPGNSGGVVPKLKYGARITTPVSTTDPYTSVQPLYEGRLAFSSFDAFNNPKQVSPVDGKNTAYQWNYAGTLPTAKADHATAGQIFYESFEEATGASISLTQSRTGKRSLSINGSYSVPNVSLPSVSGNYILSYWTNEAGQGWKYYEKQISNYVSGNGSIATDAVNGLLDEVRLYPVGALMTTFTYEPLVGFTSVTDPGNTTINYEYDGFGRLKYIKDLNSNIVETYDYQFLQNVPFPAGN